MSTVQRLTADPRATRVVPYGLPSPQCMGRVAEPPNYLRKHRCCRPGPWEVERAAYCTQHAGKQLDRLGPPDAAVAP